MYEKMLVPLDGSSAAEIILPYAEEIAAKLDTKIILVSVSDPDAADVDHLYRSYLENITEQVQRQLKELGAKEATEVTSEVLLGKPHNEIVRYATESDVSVIAMAGRSSSGEGPWLLGDIAAKVLRETDRPVLLIRVPASGAALEEKRLIKKILLPLDGSRTGEAAIPYTELLARALGAELALIHIIEPLVTWAGIEGSMAYAAPQDEENRKASAMAYLAGIGKSLKERGINTSIMVGFGSSADNIIDYAGANNIDLIAMSSHGRSGIGRWVFGSITAKVLRAGDIPVLVVRAAKK